MKILHYVKVLTAGGAGRMIRGLIRHLPHQSEVAVEWDHVDLPMGDIPVHTQLGPWEMDRLLSNGDFDLVHWHWWTDMPVMSWVHEAGLRIPQVLTLHVYSQLPEHRMPDRVMNMVDRIGYASSWSHELPCYRHLPPEKAHFIIAGAELEEASALERQQHVGFHIGRCGGLDPAKCPPDLIRIFDRIEIPGARFTIAGPGSLLEPMRTEASMGTPGRYHLPGYLQDVYPLLGQLDVYCYQLPPHSYAASELNIQEAMVAGLPVVFLPSRGCRDLVQNEVTGLVVETENELVAACERLYHEPELRQRLGARARDHAHRFFGAHTTAIGYHAFGAKTVPARSRASLTSAS